MFRPRPTTVQAMREETASSKFDVSSFLDGDLRSCFLTSDIDVEDRLVKSIEELAELSVLAADEIEAGVTVLQSKVATYNSRLAGQLDKFQMNLGIVSKKLEAVAAHFSEASDGAVKIGARLSAAEHQRRKVKNAIDVMEIIYELQAIPLESFEALSSQHTEEQIRELLPQSIRNMDWAHISRMLYDLRRVLQDINNDELSGAQENVQSVSQMVENELLSLFEVLLGQILNARDPQQMTLAADKDKDEEALQKAQDLVSCLQYFNNGKSAQDVFLFIVVQNRIQSYKILDPEQRSAKMQTFADLVAANTVTTVMNVKDFGQGMASKVTSGLNFMFNAVDVVAGTVLTEVISRGQDAVELIDGVTKHVITRKAKKKGGKGKAPKTVKKPQDGDDISDGGDTLVSGDSPQNEEVDGDDGSTMVSGEDDDDNDEDDTDSAKSGETFHTGMPVSKKEEPEDDIQVSLAPKLDISTVPLIGGLLANEEAPDSSARSLLVDKLSLLFNSISGICREQFTIICRLFNRTTAVRLIRSLVGRFFDDPRFGLHMRIKMILAPPAPILPLPDAEYLDALYVIREKLSGLYCVIIDYGESALNSLIVQESKLPQFNMTSGVFLQENPVKDTKSDLLNKKVTYDSTEFIEKSLRELKSYVDGHVSHAMEEYLADYFVKELTNLKETYLDNLMQVVDDKELIKKLPKGAVPRLNPSRFRNIDHITRIIGNDKYVARALMITTDSVQRLKSIGRDDPKLPWLLRDVYLIHLEFIVDGVLLAWSAACNSIVLRRDTYLTRVSNLPPLELVNSVGVLWRAAMATKDHLDLVFAPVLADAPNVIALCVEKRRLYMHKIEGAIALLFRSWAKMSILHLAKVLDRVQSKYDYAPKPLSSRMSTAFGLLEPEKVVTLKTTLGGQEIVVTTTNVDKQTAASTSTACDTVCKSLIVVINCIRSNLPSLGGINLDDYFWLPFGKQFIGLLISHLRNKKVTPEGAFVLMKDLEAYVEIAMSLERPETLDMMLCLKDIGFVFMISPGKVFKYVLEDLRHLDMTVVLPLVRARSDYIRQKYGRHWTHELAVTYPSFHKSDPLPWEVTSLKECKEKDILGPSTIRNTSAPLSEGRKLQLQRDMLIKQAKEAASSESSFSTAIKPGVVDDKTSMTGTALPSHTNVKAAADDGGGNAFENDLVSEYPKAAGSRTIVQPRKPNKMISGGVTKDSRGEIEKKSKENTSKDIENGKKDTRKDIEFNSDREVTTNVSTSVSPPRLIDKLKLSGLGGKDRTTNLLNKMGSIFQPPTSNK